MIASGTVPWQDTSNEIGRPDALNRTSQVVPQSSFNLRSDSLFPGAGSCKENSKGRCLRPLDPLRMVVRYLGCPCRFS